MTKKPLWLTGLLQALGVAAYCGLAGIVFWKGGQWFGNQTNYVGPFMVLTLFSASALVCAFIALGYPAFLIWKKNQPVRALRLIGWTALFLVLIVAATMTAVALSR